MTLLTYYKVHYLRVYSWQQADKVMSTETGINILKTVDNTTDFAEIMLDKYLPPSEEEIHINTGNIYIFLFFKCNYFKISNVQFIYNKITIFNIRYTISIFVYLK